MVQNGEMANANVSDLLVLCAFYEEGTRDPGALLAQGTATYVPQIGSKVNLWDGKRAATYLVTDVEYSYRVVFQDELTEWATEFESGNAERIQLEPVQRASVFVQRVEPLFDKVPQGFPL